MLVLFVLAMFISSALLFVIEPMFAKMVLPIFGGIPVVWNTCMVFFQAALLAGYAYAHLLTRHFKLKSQTLIHILVLLTPLAVLPVVVPSQWTPRPDANPFWALFGLLFFGVGLPFFVVSTSGPLLQRWFLATGHHQARDPYFLYAASNLGSMIGLLAYPVLLEPWLTTHEQSKLWSAGYGVLVLFSTSCALAALLGARRAARASAVTTEPASTSLQPIDGLVFAAATESATARFAPLSWLQRFRWVLLAAAPSSLMLGLTLHLTTDIAAVPLLWVIPLAAYLLSFIVVFSRQPLIPHAIALRIMPILVLLLVLLLVAQAAQPVWLVMSLHVLVFFAVALVCHGELAADRPAPAHLTEFYLLLSAGGVIGGIFNALLAPLLFKSVAEYPIAVVLACLLRPAPVCAVESGDAPGRHRAWVLDFAWPVALALLTVGLIGISDWLHFSAGPVWSLVTAALLAMICFAFLDRPIRFGLGAGAILLAGSLNFSEEGHLLYVRRSYFGVLSVQRLHVNEAELRASFGSPAGQIPASQTGGADYQFNALVHGNTFHGTQLTDPQSGHPIHPQEPLMYYHPHGPIGEVMQTLLGCNVPAGLEPENTRTPTTGPASPEKETRVGLVGMGAGALAAYAGPGRHFTFYEIDPLVEEVAVRSGYFTYIPEARRRGAIVDVVLGDARLTLAGAPDRAFDLLVLDAFSSDSIPLHLLTREALHLYQCKLATGGVLAWHISNKYLRLEPVVAALAKDAGLACFICDDTRIGPWWADYVRGWSPSVWVVLAQDESRLALLLSNPRWKRLVAPAGQAVWTDDYTNILSVLKWFNQEVP